MIKKNLTFIDIETTGLDYDTHEIIEVAGVVTELTTTDGAISMKVLEEFEFKISPKHIELADPRALKINKYDEREWTDAVSLKEGMELLASKTKDTIMVAHNIIFDYSFLDRAFRKTGVKNTMHYYGLDTISIAHTKLILNEEVDKVSLHELCRHFGIENKDEHTALSDARATFELFKKLLV